MTEIHGVHWLDNSFQRRLAALLRAIANDLKRDDEAAEQDLGIAAGAFQELTSAQRLITWDLIQRAVEVWPINERDLLPIHDDTVEGILVHREIQSKASARVLDRGGAPYYEYRDTAMSRLASFRPEWIKMLCVVDDDDPYNAAIQWNNGHLLYQFTYFVGAVNYYYKHDDELHCVAMNTGDSVFGMPYAPHSFASRSRDEPAYILALTYGGELVGSAQRELSALGPVKARSLVLDGRSHTVLSDYLAARAMTTEELASRCGIDATRVARVVSNVEPLDHHDLARICAVLDVSERDLLPVCTSTKSSVRIQLRSAAHWHTYSTGRDRYRFTRLASDTSHPHTTALEMHVLQSNTTNPEWLSTYQHQYLYVLEGEVVMSSRHNEHVTETRLFAGDSVYVSPRGDLSFYSDSGSVAKVLMLRIGGAVSTEVRYALGHIAGSAIDRYLDEDQLWFKCEEISK